MPMPKIETRVRELEGQQKATGLMLKDMNQRLVNVETKLKGGATEEDLRDILASAKAINERLHELHSDMERG